MKEELSHHGRQHKDMYFAIEPVTLARDLHVVRQSVCVEVQSLKCQH